MYLAHAVNVRTGRGAARTFDSAGLAAENLLILLRADGWTVDAAETLKSLLAGDRLSHKNFVYYVTEGSDRG